MLKSLGNWFVLAAGSDFISTSEVFHLFIKGKFLKICQIFTFAIT